MADRESTIEKTGGLRHQKKDTARNPCTRIRNRASVMTLSFPRSQSWAFGPPEEDGNGARPAHCVQVSAGARLGAAGHFQSSCFLRRRESRQHANGVVPPRAATRPVLLCLCGARVVGRQLTACWIASPALSISWPAPRIVLHPNAATHSATSRPQRIHGRRRLINGGPPDCPSYP
jgi:hypothetical protein